MRRPARGPRRAAGSRSGSWARRARAPPSPRANDGALAGRPKASGAGAAPRGAGIASNPGTAPLEIAPAPRAQGPVEADEAGAVGADAVQARAARRADDPGAFDPARARRAAVDRLDLGEQRLFGQGPFVDLADALLRSDDAVRDDRQREEAGVKMMTRRGGKSGGSGLSERSCMSRKAQYAAASQRMTT